MSGEQDKFTTTESRALLLAIFPRYPDLRGCRPSPDPQEFLKALRRSRAEEVTSVSSQQ
jgi:hypothetical protein